MSSSDIVSASDWCKGIALSILASIIGAGSKLAIRKSWLLQHARDDEEVSPTATADYYAEQGESSSPTSPYQVLARQGSTHSSVHSRESATHDEASDGFDHDPVVAANVGTTTAHSGGGLLIHCLRGSGMIGMTFLNPACCVWAMNYASPSILAPFSGLTLVWIVVLSQPMISERPSRRQVVAASLIVGGEVLVAVFGDHLNAPEMTLDKVTQSYKTLPFLLYVAGTMLWMSLVVYWMKYARNRTLKRFAWGVAGGSLTGFQNFLKDFLTLLQVRQPHESLPWYTWLFALLAGLTAFGGLLFLTWCMKRYDATYSAAMFVGSFVVNASIMSAVHYQTFQHLEGWINWILYPAGILVLMGGVWILVKEKGAAVVVTLPDGTMVEEVAAPDHAINTSINSATSAVARVELQEPLVVAPDNSTLA